MKDAFQNNEENKNVNAEKTNPENLFGIPVNVTALSDQSLLFNFGKAVKSERKITHLVLRYIVEIEARKLYLNSHSSISAFLIKEHGYEDGAAHRRISASKILTAVPSVADKLQAGTLNLRTLCQVRTAILTVQREENREMALEEKEQLINLIESKTADQAAVILAKELDLPIPVASKTVFHKDESITLSITFSKDEMDFLKEVQGLISHTVPNKNLKDAIMYLAQKEYDRRTKVQRRSKLDLEFEVNDKVSIDKAVQNTLANNEYLSKPEDTVPVLKETISAGVVKLKDIQKQTPARKAIRPHLRKFIFQRDQCCQYKNPQTGKVCGSKHFVQTDHIQPIWAGGDNSPGNLQLLCAQHNRYKYRKEAGYSH